MVFEARASIFAVLYQKKYASWPWGQESWSEPAWPPANGLETLFFFVFWYSTTLLVEMISFLGTVQQKWRFELQKLIKPCCFLGCWSSSLHFCSIVQVSGQARKLQLLVGPSYIVWESLIWNCLRKPCFPLLLLSEKRIWWLELDWSIFHQHSFWRLDLVCIIFLY